MGIFFFDIGVIEQEEFWEFFIVIKSFSLRSVTLRPTFELRPFGVEFVVDKREQEQISLRVLRVYAVSAIPPVFRTHLHLQSFPLIAGQTANDCTPSAIRIFC